MNIENLTTPDWETIRAGFFHGDEYRIPCPNVEQESALLKKLDGGRRSWNPEIGGYVAVGRDHAMWPTICKMKS